MADPEKPCTAPLARGLSHDRSRGIDLCVSPCTGAVLREDLSDFTPVLLSIPEAPKRNSLISFLFPRLSVGGLDPLQQQTINPYEQHA